LAALLKERYGEAPRLIKGSGGVYTVMVGSELIFSKKQVGRFPSDEEITEPMDALLPLN